MKKVTIEGIEYVPETEKLSEKNKDGLEYCIIRTYSAGVFAGWIDTKSKDTCQEVFESRQLWRWWAEFTLSSLAIKGQNKDKDKEKENKYTMTVPKRILYEIIEVIPCSEKAKEIIINTPNYLE